MRPHPRSAAPSRTPARAGRSGRAGRSRLGAALPTVAALLACGAAIVAAFTLAPAPSAPAVSALPADPEPITVFEIAAALSAVGLDAASLAAAGLSSVETSALVADARDYLAGHLQEYRDAEASHAAALAAHHALTRRVQSGQASQADLANYETARASLASAASARQTLLAALSSAATAELAPAKASALATLHANRAWEVPIQYRAASRSQAQWVALRDALANARIAQRYGHQPDPNAHQLLLDADSHQDVAAAALNLHNLPTVRSAWNQAASP